jgi:hypothetical protein
MPVIPKRQLIAGQLLVLMTKFFSSLIGLVTNGIYHTNRNYRQSFRLPVVRLIFLWRANKDLFKFQRAGTWFFNPAHIYSCICNFKKYQLFLKIFFFKHTCHACQK